MSKFLQSTETAITQIQCILIEREQYIWRFAQSREGVRFCQTLNRFLYHSRISFRGNLVVFAARIQEANGDLLIESSRSPYVRRNGPSVPPMGTGAIILFDWTIVPNPEAELSLQLLVLDVYDSWSRRSSSQIITRASIGRYLS